MNFRTMFVGVLLVFLFCNQVAISIELDLQRLSYIRLLLEIGTRDRLRSKGMES